MNPRYRIVVLATFGLLLLGYLAAAFMPRLLEFNVVSRYGPTYAFWMYLAAAAIPALVQSAGILTLEFLARFRPTD